MKCNFKFVGCLTLKKTAGRRITKLLIIWDSITQSMIQVVCPLCHLKQRVAFFSAPNMVLSLGGCSRCKTVIMTGAIYTRVTLSYYPWIAVPYNFTNVLWYVQNTDAESHILLLLSTLNLHTCRHYWATLWDA